MAGIQRLEYSEIKTPIKAGSFHLRQRVAACKNPLRDFFFYLFLTYNIKCYCTFLFILLFDVLSAYYIP
jgi:hypothetical protein